MFGKQRTFASLQKEEACAHWEPRKGTSDQARAYCSKEETRISGPYEYGTYETSQGTRTDLKQAIAALRDGGIKRVREEYPDTYVKYSRGLHNLLLSDVRQRDRPREVSILYGPPGCGKTRYFYDREPDGCSIPCDHGFWFDGYEGQRAVLLDDFDGRASKWPLNSLLRVIDRYVFLVPIKDHSSYGTQTESTLPLTFTPDNGMIGQHENSSIPLLFEDSLWSSGGNNLEENLRLSQDLMWTTPMKNYGNTSGIP